MEAKTESPTPAQKPINENWKATIDSAKNATLDDLKFIFYQAEKRLDDGIKNFDATTTKSISFITLTATLLTALTAYFFVNVKWNGYYDPKLYTVLFGCAYTFFVLFRFIGIILPKSYQPIGSFPQDLYTEFFFKGGPTQSTLQRSTLELYLCELENYNKRIAENDTLNQSRLKVFRQSVYLICSMPIVCLLVYCFLESSLVR